MAKCDEQHEKADPSHLATPTPQPPTIMANLGPHWLRVRPNGPHIPVLAFEEKGVRYARPSEGGELIEITADMKLSGRFPETRNAGPAMQALSRVLLSVDKVRHTFILTEDEEIAWMEVLHLAALQARRWEKSGEMPLPIQFAHVDRGDFRYDMRELLGHLVTFCTLLGYPITIAGFPAQGEPDPPTVTQK